MWYSSIYSILIVGDRMYKLVISGFDGTLLDDDLAISLSTVLTIDQVRRKNCKFVIASGRDINFIKDYIKDVNFIDYIISLNGSYIYDVLKEECIFEKSIKKAVIKKIVKQYKNQAVKVFLCTDHSRCFLNVNQEDTNEIIIRDLDDFLKYNKVYKIEIHTKTQKESKEILKQIKNQGLELNLNLHKYDNKDYFIEITHSCVSKYQAALFIAKKEKIKSDEIIAYGDYYNDLELVKKVGLGIGVDNAVVDLKKVCKEIVFSNKRKGVEKSLRKIFLIK